MSLDCCCVHLLCSAAGVFDRLDIAALGDLLAGAGGTGLTAAARAGPAAAPAAAPATAEQDAERTLVGAGLCGADGKLGRCLTYRLQLDQSATRGKLIGKLSCRQEVLPLLAASRDGLSGRQEVGKQRWVQRCHHPTRPFSEHSSAEHW